MASGHEGGAILHRLRRGVRRHGLSLGLGAGAVALHAAAYAFFANRNPYQESIFPPCPILHLTGWQCPGCGGTRSLYSLLHGDVIGSIAMNPIVVTGYAAVAVGLLGVWLDGRGRRGLAQAGYWLSGGLLLASALFAGVVRNII